MLTTADATGPADLSRSVWRYFADPEFRVAHADELFTALPEHAPVVAFPHFVVLSSHRQVKQVALDPRLRIPTAPFPRQVAEDSGDFVAFFTDTLSFQPAADHQRLRGVLGAAFSPTAVREQRELIGEVVSQSLTTCLASAAPSDRPAGRGDTGARVRLEFVSAFADTLPILVTAALLGVDAADRDWLCRRSHALLATLQVSFPASGAHHGQPIGAAEFAEVIALVHDLLDQPRTALTRTLNSAIHAGSLSHDEAVKLVVLLLMTGVDTVTAGLTNAVHLIARHQAFPAIQDGRLDAGDAFAESLRLMSPSAFAPRQVQRRLTIAGHGLEPGDAVMLCYAGANRDPARFEDPTAWLPGRRPAGHLAFGHGAHHCLGAALGRDTAVLAIRALARLRPTPDPDRVPDWRREVTFRGPASLPLELDRPGAPAVAR